MYKLAPLLAIAGGLAALRIPMDAWLRLGLESGLGILSILWLSWRAS